MSKLPATHANEVATLARDGFAHGNSDGFAGPGSQGDSDATTPTPSTTPDAQGQFAGPGVSGDNSGEWVTNTSGARDLVTGLNTDPKNR